ncbi:MAG: hypothetical protein ACOX32_00375 [Bacteroidaceae bacterium]|jgi:hypothetical protein|nr:hypothetical protein [Bacteroidaceae bacterium]MBP8602428.1 hypothetical protein [Bacteroidaceae bacterium]HOD68492.1 hypothetical protein [Bacteroidaceae bacterium]HPB03909.1 hypothetical protein [Bacteroidaceae bacterium]HQL25896.1 hypothetical protein [Bacteroidaceae bacterium]
MSITGRKSGKKGNIVKRGGTIGRGGNTMEGGGNIGKIYRKKGIKEWIGKSV